MLCLNTGRSGYVNTAYTVAHLCTGWISLFSYMLTRRYAAMH
nr:MAG TPA: hypothetical protein [Bacteriophage sp.]DAZ69447.1 MAG TPA: hypothetical protein [Caudoviricetes sp.]